MAIPALALAGGTALASILGGVFGKRAHNKYAEQLENTELQLPDSLGLAEDIYKELSTQGLVGKESIQSDIEGTIPSTINVAKESVDSPSALLGLLSQVQENVSSDVRRLGIEDEAARLRNKSALARFESQVKAPMELQVDQYNQALDLSAGQERMMGTQELLAGFAEGIGGGASIYGQSQYLDFLKGMNKGGSGSSANDIGVTFGDLDL